MSVHTMDDLRQMQALPLSIKIRMTEQRIREWVREYGEDGVYISFSGGKDSTVLLDIVRNRCGYDRIPAVFFDTGLEYPEIRDFVKTFDNVEWLKPELTFKEVIKKYGYPFISKEVGSVVQGARSYLRDLKKRKTMLTDRQTDRQTDSIRNAWAMADALGIDRREDKQNEAYQRLKMGNIPSPYRWRQIQGILLDKNGKKSAFNKERYAFFLDAPFEITDKCCNVMKKNPAKKYGRESGRVPIIATMAEESVQRRSHWLQEGCNVYDSDHPKSKPMSFWTEQDVLRYIKEYEIPIASVYGEIVPDYGEEQCEGQMSIEDFGLVPDQRKLKTTGCQRTGCMFCGFGCHLNNDQRFVLMKTTHPKQYEYIMKPKDQGGLGYKEVIDWINEHGDLNIKY